MDENQINSIPVGDDLDKLVADMKGIERSNSLPWSTAPGIAKELLDELVDSEDYPYFQALFLVCHSRMQEWEEAVTRSYLLTMLRRKKNG